MDQGDIPSATSMPRKDLNDFTGNSSQSTADAASRSEQKPKSHARPIPASLLKMCKSFRCNPCLACSHRLPSRNPGSLSVSCLVVRRKLQQKNCLDAKASVHCAELLSSHIKSAQSSLVVFRIAFIYPVGTFNPNSLRGFNIGIGYSD